MSQRSQFSARIEAGDQIGQRQIAVDVVAHLYLRPAAQMVRRGSDNRTALLAVAKVTTPERLPQGRRESAANSSRLCEVISSMCSGRNNSPVEETIWESCGDALE